MGFAGNDVYRAGASNAISGGVELRERRKGSIGAGVTIWEEYVRKMDSGGPYIGRTRLEIPKIMIDGKGPARDISVAEITRDRT